MAFVIEPVLGCDVTNIYPATVYGTTSTLQQPPHRIGDQHFASDGKVYVFAKANASITASTTVCTVSASTFLVTASAGSYTSPATNMVTGDYGWFSRAGV